MEDSRIAEAEHEPRTRCASLRGARIAPGDRAPARLQPPATYATRQYDTLRAVSQAACVRRVWYV